ncbi:hypothetical protein EUTSA_v10022037mg [Eutrema salsugineum]|uniref:Uncharacterized protein n=1 Tax=Eutrema salsugineum TaxID=72664 RepID=V4M5B9_EUTSA|nr:uncharacterized protein LOC18025300 [Eutrema salsugineum]ESQ47473.1 hypothetical protein EUTSA_v10022037mg [Eutrema salsugineum]
MITTKAIGYSLFLVYLALALISSSSADEASIFTVKLINFLEPGSSPVTIHCTSPPKRDTFTSVLNRGEGFPFQFDTTQQVQWSCDISSGGKKGSFLIFDVNRDRGRCKLDGLCLWRIYRDGLFLYNAPLNKFEKQFSW